MSNLKTCINLLCLLLLSTSLNAQIPPQKPQPAPQTTKRSPVQKTEKDSKPVKYNTPILTPEQVIEGLLRLADSLNNRSNLNPTLVRETMGISMKQQRGGDFWRYTFANAIPDTEWAYNFSLFPSSGTKKPELYFYFFPINAQNNFYPSYSSICQIDMDSIHLRLIKMGYKHIDSFRLGEIGLARKYQRGEIYIYMNYIIDNKGNFKLKCLSELRFI